MSQKNPCEIVKSISLKLIEDRLSDLHTRPRNEYTDKVIAELESARFKINTVECPIQPSSPEVITAPLNEYIGAIGDEYKAVERYRNMIEKSSNHQEKELLKHILAEEIEHVKELKEASELNGLPERERVGQFIPKITESQKKARRSFMEGLKERAGVGDSITRIPIVTEKEPYRVFFGGINHYYPTAEQALSRFHRMMSFGELHDPVLEVHVDGEWVAPDISLDTYPNEDEIFNAALKRKRGM